MATILMGWELGEGLGHVQRLRRIAQALAAEGHRPVFALCNVVEPWPLLRADSFAVLPAPSWEARRPCGEPPFVAASLADVLAVRGWGSVVSLQPLVAAWQQLVEYVQPSLIVTDYAPTLCLTAFEMLPVVQVGNWFPLPPVDQPTFPLLLPGQAPVLPQGDVLAVAQEVQRLRQRPIPRTLTGIFAWGDRFPTFFPELDPYRELRHEPVWDPLEPMPSDLPEQPAPSFFAYLTADNANVEAWLTQMALTGYPGTAYLRNAPAALKERLRLQGLTILDQPAPLADMLARSTVIVHHGGSTTASAAFAAGRAQLLFPQHVEQATTAQLLARLGVAAHLFSNASPETAGRTLRQLIEGRRHTEAARDWARRVQERRLPPTLPAIVERCRLRLAAAK